jgi:hypothetical protein
MKIEQKVIQKLEALITDGEIYLSASWEAETFIHEWKLSSLNILKTAIGEDSEYFKAFQKVSTGFSVKYDVHIYDRKEGIGILKAAKKDYEEGFIFKIQERIQAELFVDFLERAEYLYKSGDHEPAAVIAGCVLEDGLRKLCIKNEIELEPDTSLNKMNTDLYRKEIYNKVVFQQIQSLAAIRNNAAHGKFNEFTKQDVQNMIAGIKTFMQQNFS